MSFIFLASVQIAKACYTMKVDSRGGQLICTSPSDGSRLVVDVMSYRNRRAGRTADCKKRFVEEADMDSRTCQEDVVSIAPGERKGLATF